MPAGSGLTAKCRGDDVAGEGVRREGHHAIADLECIDLCAATDNGPGALHAEPGS